MTSLCPVCSSELPESKTRPVIYCKESCKKKAKRARLKTSLITVVSEEPSLISKKTAFNSKKVVSISGTVQRLPVVSKSSEILVRYICRNIDDIKALFEGRYELLEIDNKGTKLSPLSIKPVDS